MRILKQPKKAYQAPYIQCFHHITVEQILGASVSGDATDPGGSGTNPITKQTSFFFDEDEEEEEEDGYYW